MSFGKAFLKRGRKAGKVTANREGLRAGGKEHPLILFPKKKTRVALKI